MSTKRKVGMCAAIGLALVGMVGCAGGRASDLRAEEEPIVLRGFGGEEVAESGPETVVVEAAGAETAEAAGESFDDFASAGGVEPAAEEPVVEEAGGEAVMVADAPRVSPEPLPVLRPGLPKWVKGTPVKK